MTGHENFEPAGVPQSPLFQFPVTHAQLLIVTFTVGFFHVPGSNSTWPPNSDACCAWKGWDAKFPGSGLGMSL